MSELFGPRANLVVINASVAGPKAIGRLRLALDTGATTTLIDSTLLAAVGYDIASATDYSRITTGSRIERVPRVRVESFEALGQRRISLEVLAHTLPSSAGVDGLLGLDFLRGRVLTLDFRRGLLSLT